MRIATIRKKQGLTQKDVAKAVGVDQTTVHLWETGKTSPRVGTLIRLAEFLKCTVNDLLQESTATTQDKTQEDAIT